MHAHDQLLPRDIRAEPRENYYDEFEIPPPQKIRYGRQQPCYAQCRAHAGAHGRISSTTQAASTLKKRGHANTITGQLSVSRRIDADARLCRALIFNIFIRAFQIKA